MRTRSLSYLVAISLFFPQIARAGGFEFAGAGAVANARGGAYAARADDPMAILYNPANLAGMSGMQLHMSNSLLFWHACFNRNQTYLDFQDSAFNSEPLDSERFGEGATQVDYESTNFPEVCQSQRVNWVPEIAWAWRVSNRIGIGAGVVSPSAVATQSWGNNSGLFAGTMMNDGSVIPTPTRYSVISQNLVMVFPTVAIGAQLHPRFRLGASFGSGFAIVNAESMVHATAGEEASQDMRARLSLRDKFIPRMTVSAHAIPHDNIDVMASFTYQGDLNAEGQLGLDTMFYIPGVGQVGGPGVNQQTRYDIDGIKLRTQLPWQLAFAFRYADRIRTREEVNLIDDNSIHDGLADERWDIELDVGYEINSRVQELAFVIPDADPSTPEYDSHQIDINPTFDDLPMPQQLPPNRMRWKNQLSLRLGGSYNPIQNRLGISGGFSFETHGVERGYEQVTFMPFQRYGLHTGVTYRVNRFDFQLAYSHYFQKQVDVGMNDACPEPIGNSCTTDDWGVRQVVADPSAGAGTVINAGRYRSGLDMLTLGVTYHIQ